MNITRAPTRPFRSLRTAVRPHIAGHRRHAPASATSAANSLRLTSSEFSFKTTDMRLRDRKIDRDGQDRQDKKK
jgi:hypothetical protein